MDQPRPSESYANCDEVCTAEWDVSLIWSVHFLLVGIQYRFANVTLCYCNPSSTLYCRLSAITNSKPPRQTPKSELRQASYKNERTIAPKAPRVQRPEIWQQRVHVYREQLVAPASFWTMHLTDSLVGWCAIPLFSAKHSLTESWSPDNCHAYWGRGWWLSLSPVKHSLILLSAAGVNPLGILEPDNETDTFRRLLNGFG